MRQMVMVGFLQAQNCTNLVSSWRHPESRRIRPPRIITRRLVGYWRRESFTPGFSTTGWRCPTAMATTIGIPSSTVSVV